MVLLKSVPSGLPSGLPKSDQRAIARAVGTQVHFLGYDDDGRAELEFIDDEGIIHFIYVDASHIGPVHGH